MHGSQLCTFTLLFQSSLSTLFIELLENFPLRSKIQTADLCCPRNLISQSQGYPQSPIKHLKTKLFVLYFVMP